jgi:hypothetical protein
MKTNAIIDNFMWMFLRLVKETENCSFNIFRYSWQQFSVVTSDVAGHDDFVQVNLEETSMIFNRNCLRLNID